MIKKIICRRLEVLLFVVLIAAGLVSLPVIASAETAQDPAATDAAAEEAVPAVQGDAGIGKMLFTGEKRFENGGPACISCHNVGLGALGGGTLGPNLMLPNEKYGVGPAPQNPLIAAAWINSAGTPVMGAIFSRKNVTDDEVTHLKAFFSTLPAEQTSKSGAFVGISAAGFVGILIFFSIVWSGRYRKRCGGTAHEAIWRNYGGKGGK
jgi:mono/diheme cytochrome c family protein